MDDGADMEDQQPPTTPPVGEPTAPIAQVAPTQVAAAPVEPTGGRKRRRWWILAVLGIVLVLVLVAIARNRNEESVQRQADETATSVPGTVAPDGGAPGGVPGGGETPSGGGSGESAPAPGEPPGDVTELAAPSVIRIADQCQEIAPVDVAPCTVTVYWADRATDETAYRVVVQAQKAGARIAQLASDSTSYGTGAAVGDTVCFEVVAVRGDETASSGQECATTDLDQ